MTYWWQTPDARPLAAGGYVIENYICPVKPALVLAARRGFVQSYVVGGFGTFQDDDVERAEDFFDSLVDKGYWSDAAYRDYAEMDPWKDDE